MLSSAQRLQLQQLILEFIGLDPRPAAVVQLVGGDALARVPAGVNGYRVAVWVLDVVLREPEPDRFVALVLACDPMGSLVEVHAMLPLLRDPARWAGSSASGAPDELWVPPDWPFVDRRELRDTIRRMADGDGPPVITVEAPTGYGKRTVCQYIEQYGRRRGSFAPSVVHVQEAVDEWQLSEIVAELRLAMDLDPAVHTSHDEIERQAVEHVRLLTLDVLGAGVVGWLVLNVVQPQGFGDGLRRFVDELVLVLRRTPELARRLRVVLVADDLDQLALTHLPELEARFVLSDLSPEWISEWLAAASPGLSAELYRISASAVLDKVTRLEPPASKRLRWLAVHCAQAHRTLEGVPRG